MSTLNIEDYKQTIRELSDRLVDAQRPIRILDAIKWSPHIQKEFFRKKCKEMPVVDKSYYEKQRLGYDTHEKTQQFAEIDRDIVRRLGQFSPVGNIMRRMCREYEMAIRMLEARGTPEFSSISQTLYGSAGDVFHAGDPTLADLSQMMAEALENIDSSILLQREEKNITGEEAVSILQERLNLAFGESKNVVRVLLSDGIVADAAAGADYLKIRKEARFSEREIRQLEVHEGWVHVGTTLNGLNQPVCTFLSKGPPSATITQEGLAIIVEVISFVSYPARLRRLTNRIRAVHLAEQGANFLEVFNFFREQNFTDQESYVNTTRIFRGSLPEGGPFTKDLSYSKGFILIYNFMRLAVRKGKLDRIPLLFCGKTTLEDIRTLAELVEEGVVVPPKYLPPQFIDLNGITAWMCYSNFLNRLNLQRIEADYASIL